MHMEDRWWGELLGNSVVMSSLLWGEKEANVQDHAGRKEGIVGGGVINEEHPFSRLHVAPIKGNTGPL